MSSKKKLKNLLIEKDSILNQIELLSYEKNKLKSTENIKDYDKQISRLQDKLMSIEEKIKLTAFSYKN